jgi:hypothetical protein
MIFGEEYVVRNTSTLRGQYWKAVVEIHCCILPFGTWNLFAS